MTRLEIYPQLWDEEGILEDFLLPNVRALAAFYMEAARRRGAVLLAIQ